MDQIHWKAFYDIGEMLDYDEDKKLAGNEMLESKVERVLKGMNSGKLPGNKNTTV